MEFFWKYMPQVSHDFSRPELIEMSVDQFVKGEIRFVDMLWFWLWLWVNFFRDSSIDEFYYSESVCAFSDETYNVAVAMDSGPWFAADWLEWVVAFPTPGYAIRELSNY